MIAHVKIVVKEDSWISTHSNAKFAQTIVQVASIVKLILESNVIVAQILQLLILLQKDVEDLAQQLFFTNGLMILAEIAQSVLI